MNEPAAATALAPFAPMALHLLNHPVLSEEGVYWNMLLRHAEALRDYFGQIGLALMVYEDDGFAYLTQPEQPDGDETPLPRITQRRQLTRSVTMVAVVLREYLDEWSEQHRVGRCQIAYADIYERCQPFLPPTTDERSHAYIIDTALNKLAEWEWIVRREVLGDKSLYVVRPLIKAMFGPDTLAEVREALAHDATGI